MLDMFFYSVITTVLIELLKHVLMLLFQNSCFYNYGLKVIAPHTHTHTHTHTHLGDCFTWTTKLIDNVT